MNLFDVKNALETIVQLNPGLSEDKLVTLLRASGWEETNIKEAVMLFKDIAPELVSGEVDDKHLLTEGHPKEGVASSVVMEPEVETKPVQVAQETIYKQPDVPSKERIDETIKTIESIPLKATQMAPITVMPEEHLPDTLPLKPFDSSPHAWTLGTYKDTFHNEEKKSAEAPVPEIFKPKPVTTPYVPAPLPPVQFSNPVSRDLGDEPLSGNDLSLMVLISLLLLVIVLLLGYMYSNGRLIL